MTVLDVIMTCVVLRAYMNNTSDSLSEHTLDIQEVAAYDDASHYHNCPQLSAPMTTVTEAAALRAEKGMTVTPMATTMCCVPDVSVPLLYTSLMCMIVCLACYKFACVPTAIMFVGSFTCLYKLCRTVAGKFKVLRRCFGFT